MKLFCHPEIPDNNQNSGGVIQVIRAHKHGLQKRGFTFVNHAQDADVGIYHASYPIDSTIPSIFVCHGLYPSGETVYFDTPGFHSPNQIMARNIIGADTVVTVCDWTADIIRRDFHVTPQVIRNGVWIKDFKPEGKSNGDIIWAKSGINPVCTPAHLEVLAQMNPQLPFASIAEFKPHNQINNIKFYGKKPWNYFIKLLGDCSVYLAVTKENHSIALMEAMIQGVPVVGYDFGGTRETLVNRVGCELVPPNDFYQLDEALNKVLGNWDKYHQQAIEFARDNFDWEPQITRLAEIIENVKPRKSPRVSIVIPAHNYAEYLPQAITSALDQEGVDEVIVVDDASTDDTPHVLKTYRGQDKLQVITLNKNHGVAYARNLGIQNALGDFIVCLDADDWLRPGYVKTLKPVLESDPRLGIVFTPIGLVDEKGNPKNHTWFTEDFDYQKHINGHNKIPTCAMFKKTAWQRVGGYRNRLCEDAEFWTRVVSIGWDVKKVGDKPLMSYRIHPGSRSATAKNTWYQDKFYTDWYAGTPRGTVVGYDDSLVTFVVYLGDGWDIDDVIQTFDSIETQSWRKWQVLALYDKQIELVEFIESAYPFVRFVYLDNSGETKVWAQTPIVYYLDKPRFFESGFVAQKQESGRGLISPVNHLVCI